MGTEKLKFKVSEEESGKRLDKFLADNLSEKHSRSFLQKLISGHQVTLNGVFVKGHHKVRADDEIVVSLPPAVPSRIKAETIPLDIVYEDEYLLVVDKPAGMVVHPAPGNYSATLVNALLAHCPDLSGIGGVAKPGIVHRIDKGTSGLLVVAKTDEAHRALARQFKEKTAKRVYLALVKGVVEFDNGIVEAPIGRSAFDRKRMAVKFEDSRAAKTRYKVLRRFKDYTLLELVLGSGRTHQVRVHMSYIGHPVVGDDKYGGGEMLGRPALHAATLGFVHPATERYMEFNSKIPQDMDELIKKLGAS